MEDLELSEAELTGTKDFCARVMCDKDKVASMYLWYFLHNLHTMYLQRTVGGWSAIQGRE